MLKKSTSKQHLIFFLLFFASIMVGLRLSGFEKSEQADKQYVLERQKLLRKVLECPPGENDKAYKCTVPYIAEYLKDYEIEPFFELLEERSKVDPAVGGYCHPIGHSIGRALFEISSNITVLKKCNPFCADGCTMGVMEAFLLDGEDEHASLDIIIERAEEACEEFAQGNIVKRASCIHGTGHGIMPLVLYDTADGLEACSKLQTIDKGSCYDAVFMEKFLPSDPGRRVARTGDPYRYCSVYEGNEEYKHRCFGYLPYAWAQWGKSPHDILELCSAPSVDTEGCGRALARLYVPEYMHENDPIFFEIYQQASPSLQTHMARYGGILTVEYTPEKTQGFCQRLGQSQEVCLRNMDDIINFMDVDIPR